MIRLSPHLTLDLPCPDGHRPSDYLWHTDVDSLLEGWQGDQFPTQLWSRHDQPYFVDYFTLQPLGTLHYCPKGRDLSGRACADEDHFTPWRPT